MTSNHNAAAALSVLDGVDAATGRREIDHAAARRAARDPSSSSSGRGFRSTTAAWLTRTCRSTNWPAVA
jgi:hypothetical protein